MVIPGSTKLGLQSLHLFRFSFKQIIYINLNRMYGHQTCLILIKCMQCCHLTCQYPPPSLISSQLARDVNHTPITDHAEPPQHTHSILMSHRIDLIIFFSFFDDHIRIAVIYWLGSLWLDPWKRIDRPFHHPLETKSTLFILKHQKRNRPFISSICP